MGTEIKVDSNVIKMSNHYKDLKVIVWGNNIKAVL